MPHRLAFGPDQPVPVAVEVSEPQGALLTPYDPLEGALPTEYEIAADLELLAIDATPLDQLVPSQDSVWLQASFIDTLGRRVDIRANDVALGTQGRQHFGGVATNVVEWVQNGSNGQGHWAYKPLRVWARCDIWVNDALVDPSLLGHLVLNQPLLDGSLLDDPMLILHVLPQRVTSDGHIHSVPIQAAEELGMAGWQLSWDEATYTQAPMLHVRTEKGDTLHKVAKEYTVDPAFIARANRITEESPLHPGQLLRIPMLERASSQPPKKVHPSVALTWQEIVRGWTTLN